MRGLLRELWCWMVGHRWVHADRRPQLKPDGDLDHWHSVTWWEHRCRRCRIKVNGDTWYPLWRDLWIAVSAGVMDIRWTWGFASPWAKRVAGSGYITAPFWPWWWSRVAVTPFVFWEQVLFHLWVDRRWPAYWMLTVVTDGHHHIEDWFDRRIEVYGWKDPEDPNDPTERGFWYLGDKPQTRWWVYDKSA